jgi:hypothetical protein
MTNTKSAVAIEDPVGITTEGSNGRTYVKALAIQAEIRSQLSGKTQETIDAVVDVNKLYEDNPEKTTARHAHIAATATAVRKVGNKMANAGAFDNPGLRALFETGLEQLGLDDKERANPVWKPESTESLEWAAEQDHFGKVTKIMEEIPLGNVVPQNVAAAAHAEQRRIEQTAAGYDNVVMAGLQAGVDIGPEFGVLIEAKEVQTYLVACTEASIGTVNTGDETRHATGTWDADKRWTGDDNPRHLGGGSREKF